MAIDNEKMENGLKNCASIAPHKRSITTDKVHLSNWYNDQNIVRWPINGSDEIHDERTSAGELSSQLKVFCIGDPLSPLSHAQREVGR